MSETVSHARTSVAGRLGDSADMPSESPRATTLPDAGRERTDADESRLVATVERWHAFDETKNKTPRKGVAATTEPAAADSPGPGTYDVLSVLSFGDGSKEAFPEAVVVLTDTVVVVIGSGERAGGAATVLVT